MSFNPIIKTKTNETQETQLNTSNQQIVPYRGRDFCYPPSYREEQQLVGLSMTMADRLLTGMQHMLGIDLSTIPSPIITGLRKSMMTLEKLPTTTNFSGFKMEMSIAEQIAEEEKCQTINNKLILTFKDRFDEMRLGRQKQFLLAGVTSAEELKKKELLIDSYIAKAEERYFQDQTNIKARIEIDKALINAFKETISPKDQKVIEDYWTLASQGTKWVKKIIAVQACSNELFTQEITQANAVLQEKIEQLILEKKKFNTQDLTASHYQEVLNNTSKKLINERNVAATSEEVVIFDYLILTGSYKMPTMINSLLRTYFMRDYQRAIEQLAGGVDLVKQRNQDIIQYFKDWILTCNEKISSYQKVLDSLEIDDTCRASFLKSIEFSKENIQSYNKKIESYQSYTEKDFEEMACELLGMEHPRQIKARIPKETPFDQMFNQLAEIETQGQSTQILKGSLFSLSHDMTLDLSNMDNPEEHFYNKLKQIDNQKLALIKSQGIEEII